MLYFSPDGRLSFRALFTIRRSRTAPLFEVVDVVLPFVSGRHRHCKWRLRPPNEAGRPETACRPIADIDDRTADLLQSDLKPSLAGTAASMHIASPLFVCHRLAPYEAAKQGCAGAR